MITEEPHFSRAARWLTFGAAASITVSIAAFYILLGMAMAALLLSRQRLRFPPVKLPLAVFLGITVLAWILSPDPWRHGFPQIKKFCVFLVLLLVFTTFRRLATLRWFFLAWAGLASISAVVGLVQFVNKMGQARAAGIDFYTYYVPERIKGLGGHWNTFSAQEMFAIVMLSSLLLFGSRVPKVWVWIGCGVLMFLALLLTETRAVWIATAIAGLYLAWFWKRWVVVLVPVAIALIILVSPPAIRERFTSILHAKEVDSNSFRLIAWNAGVQMIEKHPILGLGPEGPKYHFKEYVPPATWESKPPGFYEHLHNIYLQYGAERGIPGLLAFLWLLGTIGFDFARGLRKLPSGIDDRKFILHGGIALLLAMMAEGVAEVNFGDTEPLAMFLIVVACGYAAVELVEQPSVVRRSE